MRYAQLLLRLQLQHMPGCQIDCAQLPQCWGLRLLWTRVSRQQKIRPEQHWAAPKTAAEPDRAGPWAVLSGLPLGFRKRMMVEEPVGALSNLLAVMKRDVMDQPGVDAAQRLICRRMSQSQHQFLRCSQ